MKVQIQHKKPKRLLNPASGYLTGYNYTLNPYTGCSYACSYCYVRKLPVALFRREAWGTWVDVKKDVADQLRKELVKAKKKGPVTIFMSSSTDPYQPIEFKEKITRIMLEVMVDEQPDFLFVQTRGPLVTRDIDLFLELKDRVRISMTVETDLESIRKAFSPAAPPIQARLGALKHIVDAGIPAQATIAPLLPCTEHFPQTLSRIVNRICLDDFFMGDGSKGKRTEKLGIKAIYKDLNLSEWYSATAYLNILGELKKEFSEDQIFISQEGFLP
jgi:DNA repair photolyase